MIHGILIKDGTIQEIDLQDNLDTYYSVLGCSTIDIVDRWIGGKYYSVVCDDEGLFNCDAPISMMNEEDAHPMLVGSLLIANRDRDKLADLQEEDVIRIKGKWKYRLLWGRY